MMTLSPRRRAAIVALLGEPTVEAAARVAGIGKRTLIRWRAEPAFKAELERAAAESYAEALASLRALAGDATTALRDVLRDKTAQASARVAAAKVVLERSDPERGAVRAELAVAVRDEADRAAEALRSLTTEELSELQALTERINSRIESDKTEAPCAPMPRLVAGGGSNA